MSKSTKTHKSMLSELEKKPMIQDELNKSLHIDRSFVWRTLQKGVREKEVGFLWRTEDKNQNKLANQVITKQKTLNYRNVSWKKGTKKIYLKTKMSKQLFRKLKRKFSRNQENLPLISEIVDLYRAIEIFADYQEAVLTREEIVKRDLQNKGKEFSREIIGKKIRNTQKLVNDFYRHRKRKIKIAVLQENMDLSEEFKKFFWGNISMTPWMNFIFMGNVCQVKNKEGNMENGISKKLIEKLMTLWLKQEPNDSILF